MELLFDNKTNFDFSSDYMELITNVINETLKSENFNYNVEISFSLVNENEIKEINSKFRKIDKITDVLSFPLLEFPYEIKDLEHIIPLGDIIICIQRAEEQSKEYGHSLYREIGFLTAHSMLHLLGYDHIMPEEEKIMFSKQEKILNNLGITRE